METEKDVTTEAAGQTEANWSAGTITTLAVPDFSPGELRHLNHRDVKRQAEPEAKAKPTLSKAAIPADLNPIARVGSQIAGFLLGR